MKTIKWNNIRDIKWEVNKLSCYRISEDKKLNIIKFDEKI